MSALYAVEQLLDMLDKSGSAYLQTASILARGEFADLRTRITELEKRNREIESYHLNHLGIPCDMTDPDIAVLQARIAELEEDREKIIDNHISELADLHVKITEIEYDYLEYKALTQWQPKPPEEK